MKILITGGFGFIGSNFTKYLLQKSSEIQICIIDNFSKGKLSFLEDAVENIYWKEGDITNEIFVNSIFKKFGLMVNYSAYFLSISQITLYLLALLNPLCSLNRLLK